jgi:hypothetical protein
MIGGLMRREGLPTCDVILVANDALAIGLPNLNENTIIHNRRRFAWLLNEPEAPHRDCARSRQTHGGTITFGDVIHVFINFGILRHEEIRILQWD